MSKKAKSRKRQNPKLSIISQSYFLIGQGPGLVATQALAASRFAAARFPLKQEDSPRHSDALIVAGPVNRRYHQVVKRLADQLALPGRVVRLENPSSRSDPGLAVYLDAAEKRARITTEKETWEAFKTGSDLFQLNDTLQKALSFHSPSFNSFDKQSAPGTLVPLRAPQEKELATEDLTLSLGPAHPAIYGPLRLILTLDGEQIVAAEADPGFAHRGLEKLAEGQEPATAPSFGGVLDALAPLSGTLAVTMALEKLAVTGVGAGAAESPVSSRAGFLRLIVLELERIASHLFSQAWLLKTLALDGPAHQILDLYAAVQEGLSLVGGEPIGRYIVPGGVRFQPDPTTLSNLNTLNRQVQNWVSQELGPAPVLAFSTRLQHYTLQSRLKGFGVVGLDEAVELGFTGPNLRASGSAFDWRTFNNLAETGLPYNELGFKPAFSKGRVAGDAYDRYRLRIEEIAASSALVEQALQNLPATGPYRNRLELEKGFLISGFEAGTSNSNIRNYPVEAAGIVESPRGLLEARLALTLKPAGRVIIERLHFRTPSWPPFQALPALVQGARLPDALVIINSLDIAPDEAER